MTTNATVTTERAQSLIEDDDLYPRASVDGIHVQALADALRAGATLPPIIACRATRRIADGYHRRRAHLRAHGPDATLPVEWRDYESDLALYEDAITLNAAHGRRLTGYDHRRIILRGRDLGLTVERAATLLSLTPNRLIRGNLTATVTRGNGDREEIALKRTHAHLANTSITERQERAVHTAGGFTQAYYIRQVQALLDTDTLNTLDTKLLEDLIRLRDTITTYLATGGEDTTPEEA